MPPTSGSRFTNQATGRNRVDRKFLGTRKCGFQIGAEERNGRNWVALECSLLFTSLSLTERPERSAFENRVDAKVG